MTGTPGSTNLTENQERWYERRFHERYVAVQENPLRPSRRHRRSGMAAMTAQTLRAWIAALPRHTNTTDARALLAQLEIAEGKPKRKLKRAA